MRFFNIYNAFKVGVIIFYSVRFLPIKSNQIDFFIKKRQPKPVQTDRFRFGYFKKTSKNLYCVLGLMSCDISLQGLYNLL